MEDKELFVGVGVGLDHGGLGLHIEGRFTQSVSIFLGVGYNTQPVGWNAGLNYRFLPARKVCPYATAMYGYNAVSTTISSSSFSSRNHYGPSFGAGVELQFASGKRFLRFGLLVPVRSKEAIEISNNSDHPFWPVLPTVGYHF